MKNTAIKELVKALKGTHDALENTMEGVTDDIASYTPPGTANPIAGVYAHLVFGEDMFCNMILRKKDALFNTTWKNKTGISSPHPTEWTTEYPKWLKEVKIDTKKVHTYSKAVFAETEKYVASLTDKDLANPVDMSSFGMGKSTVGYIIISYIIGHASSIMGEISVLKGIQGLKGYPF